MIEPIWRAISNLVVGSGFQGALLKATADTDAAARLEDIDVVLGGLMSGDVDLTPSQAKEAFYRRLLDCWTWRVVLKGLHIVHHMLLRPAFTAKWLDTYFFPPNSNPRHRHFSTSHNIFTLCKCYREGEVCDAQAEDHSRLIRNYSSFLASLVNQLILSESRLLQRGPSYPKPLDDEELFEAARLYLNLTEKAADSFSDNDTVADIRGFCAVTVAVMSTVVSTCLKLFQIATSLEAEILNRYPKLHENDVPIALELYEAYDKLSHKMALLVGVVKARQPARESTTENLVMPSVLPPPLTRSAQRRGQTRRLHRSSRAKNRSSSNESSTSSSTLSSSNEYDSIHHKYRSKDSKKKCPKSASRRKESRRRHGATPSRAKSPLDQRSKGAHSDCHRRRGDNKSISSNDESSKVDLRSNAHHRRRHLGGAASNSSAEHSDLLALQPEDAARSVRGSISAACVRPAPVALDSGRVSSRACCGDSATLGEREAPLPFPAAAPPVEARSNDLLLDSPKLNRLVDLTDSWSDSAPLSSSGGTARRPSMNHKVVSRAHTAERRRGSADSRRRQKVERKRSQRRHRKGRHHMECDRSPEGAGTGGAFGQTSRENVQVGRMCPKRLDTPSTTSGQDATISDKNVGQSRCIISDIPLPMTLTATPFSTHNLGSMNKSQTADRNAGTGLLAAMSNSGAVASSTENFGSAPPSNQGNEQPKQEAVDLVHPPPPPPPLSQPHVFSEQYSSWL